MTKPIALITGGTRGIGLGIAQSLAAEGYDLAVCGVREQAKVETTLVEIRKSGAEVLYCQCDVSSADARETMLADIRRKFGRIDVLVNNAGVAPQRQDILEATEAEFERVLKINLQGPYFLTQQVARMMVEYRQTDAEYRPSIINVSSISATMASVNRGEYCISKSGVSMATQLWAVRLAEYEIPVFEIRPGIIETDMTSAVKEKYDALIGEGLIPQNRWGKPEDVGRVVTALAGGQLAYSTGQVLMVDGGLSMARL